MMVIYNNKDELRKIKDLSMHIQSNCKKIKRITLVQYKNIHTIIKME